MIQSYIVYYGPVGDSSNISEIIVLPSANRTRVVLPFLRPSTNYSIAVSAINSAGLGNRSRSLFARTFDSGMYTL